MRLNSCFMFVVRIAAQAALKLLAPLFVHMALISGKFDLLSAPAARGVKREAPEQPARAAKVPRASDVVVVPPQPRTTQHPRRPINAPVEVCIYRYCEQASLIWDLLQGKDDFKLYQIQITHDAQRSITFDIRTSFNDFLAKAQAENPTIPANLQQLEKEAAVKLIVADRTDTDGVGFQPWRAAFYCVDLGNFLALLDGWFKHKEMQIAREQPFEVQLRPHSSCDMEIDIDDFNYEHYTLHEKARELPLHVFHAQPVVGKRIVILNLQISSDTVFDLVITGHNYPFRGALETFGIHGGYQEAEKDNRQYVRVWKDVDISDQDTNKRFMEMLETVFKSLCLRVVLDREPTPDTDVANFVEKLRENDALFFGSVETA